MWATEDVKRSAFKYLVNVGKLKSKPEELEEGFLQVPSDTPTYTRYTTAHIN